MGVSVAIVTCISTRRGRSAMMSILGPSILRSLDRRIAYSLYIGMDTGDTFRHAAELRRLVHPVQVHIRHFAQRTPKRIPWNDILRAAWQDGNEYAMRVNDDTEFVGRNWTRRAIDRLQAFRPPNVGVVGPTCMQGNSRILTHDFVHLPTHMSIFDGLYYPSVFRNWYLDDWISLVYGAHRTEKMRDWRVTHHTQFYGTRYTPDVGARRFVKTEVGRGQERIRTWLSRWAVVVTVNHGFFDMFQNWWHHFRALRMDLPVYAIAEDHSVYRKLRHMHPSLYARLVDGGANVAMTYDTSGYKRMVSRRARHLLSVMQDTTRRILYTDVDTVWLSDPRPYMTGVVDVWGGVDDVIGERAYLCTGFLGFRHNNRTLELLRRWDRALETPQLNQPVFNRLLEPGIAVQPLSRSRFPSGNLYFSTDPRYHSHAIVVHNNFIQGKSAKIARFKHAGLWNPQFE
jgi:hypothetical protein